MDVLVEGFDTIEEAETFVYSQPLIPVLMIQDQFPEDDCEHNFDHYELREHINY
jgi:hypothetical protein